MINKHPKTTIFGVFGRRRRHFFDHMSDKKAPLEFPENFKWTFLKVPDRESRNRRGGGRNVHFAPGIVGQIDHRDMRSDVSSVHNIHPEHSDSVFAHFLASSDPISPTKLFRAHKPMPTYTSLCLLCGAPCLGPLRILINQQHILICFTPNNAHHA